MRTVCKFWWVFVLIALSGARDASAQLVANGKSLTVTTTSSIATFTGADLTGYKNQLTNEDYLKNASAGELAAVNTIASTGQTLQTSNWVIASEAGIPTATITVSDSVRSLIVKVQIDAVSQETVITISATISKAGLRDISWSIAGIDLAGGRLILPANTGSIYDKSHSPVGNFLQYPTHGWNAQMGVYETTQGSFVFYSTDTQARFKQLRYSSRASSTVDMAIVTEAIAPFTTATSVPAIEWRLKAFAGDWRTAAQVYRDWLTTNRPPTSNSNHPWVSNIRAIVGMRTLDQSLLAPLATKVVPSQTLLYVSDWRTSAYDVNYPDYTPRAGVDSFITAAQNLGFKVMLHFDLYGVSLSNPDYASVQAFHVRTSETLELTGWDWDKPPSTPTRFAYINPASSAYRTLFISRVGAAVNAVHPDAIHLDVSAYTINDGNGLIDGLTLPQGSAQLHQDLIAAFPNIALAGEGENDVLYRYESFAQTIWVEVPPLMGHPIAAFLFSPKTQYYGHLGQPNATDPLFRTFLSRAGRRGVLPQLPVNSAADLDTTNTDNARLISLIQSWQTNGFHLDETGSWAGVLVRYVGSGNTVATLTDSGTVETLTAAGSTIYQIAHDATRIDTNTLFIPSWPAFDSNTLYGLNRDKKYWLVNTPRPNSTHITNLPDDVSLGPESLSTPKAVHFELQRVATSPFDFFAESQNAVQGVTFQGADGPLANGASVISTYPAVGGVQRQALFMHPPFQGQIGGETFAQWSIQIGSGVKFQFSVGVQDGAACNLDGVTFKVLVNGVQAYNQNYGPGAWHDGTVDLGGYANTTIQLRLVNNPGPQNNPNCDWGAWSLLMLAYTTEPPAFLSIPLTLAGGSTFSGISGNGTFVLNSPQSATVSSVPIPGQFTVFSQTGTDVVNGTNLANLPFEMFMSEGGGVAQSAAGCCPVGSGTAGGVTKSPTIFAHPPVDGRTILSWVLRLPDASSLRLGWSAGIRDEVTSQDGVDFSVLIDGVAYWKFTSQAKVWTSGSLDLGLWRGKNVLVELVTDSRTNFYRDHAMWADLVLSNSVVSCTYDLSPAQTTVGSTGTTQTLNVTTPATCPWFTTGSVPWITINSGGAAAGSGVVSYSVAPNPGAPRYGALIVAGKVFTLNQADSNGVLPRRTRP